MEDKICYKSNGAVLGNYWGGGSGSYPVTTFHSDISKEDLLEQNKKALESGTLDSGMGFESLIGAKLIIETTITKIIDNKKFVNKDKDIEWIGNLTESQMEFLDNIL